MSPLLDAHTMQRYTGRQRGGDALPQIDRQRLPRREPGSRGEGRDVPVNMPSVEALYDFALEQSVEGLEAHDPSAGGVEHPFHGHETAIAVAMVPRSAGELRQIGKPVRSRKLHDPCEIAGRHYSEYPHGRGLEREYDGAPGASARSRAASAVIAATSSTPPTSARTCTPAPNRSIAIPVTRPDNTLRADAGSRSRLTKMSVGGIASTAGPVRSVRTTMATLPTRACFTPSPAGRSTRNRFSGVTGDSRPSASARMSSAQRYASSS